MFCFSCVWKKTALTEYSNEGKARQRRGLTDFSASRESVDAALAEAPRPGPERLEDETVKGYLVTAPHSTSAVPSQCRRDEYTSGAKSLSVSGSEPCSIDGAEEKRQLSELDDTTGDPVPRNGNKDSARPNACRVGFWRGSDHASGCDPGETTVPAQDADVKPTIEELAAVDREAGHSSPHQGRGKSKDNGSGASGKAEKDSEPEAAEIKGDETSDRQDPKPAPHAPIWAKVVVPDSGPKPAKNAAERLEPKSSVPVTETLSIAISKSDVNLSVDGGNVMDGLYVSGGTSHASSATPSVEVIDPLPRKNCVSVVDLTGDEEDEISSVEGSSDDSDGNNQSDGSLTSSNDLADAKTPLRLDAPLAVVKTELSA
ncbi:hypothetical protein CC85DRAFT_327036 [Cutaneotrichosporon oleaginosum]|uniref:Uncharacterized protein n=1 Tax=Cutaneotrichosporon oleaginosum TaxID=879819 RepID=A0A0J0XS61_9TREE|nr:uncharacterized protein CC85DRAFT_327036 [Cutaneotrichosporon oleaginosum]KLT43913.1 hypothetical protein CC85DRAFT_327036 [Cutaneotrichosporon oleaginosum]TXT06349.1 hypothetical protein COLE_05680 [Cutaneotrichosporon oleaginosum]